MDSIEPHHRYGKRFSLISIAAAIALVLGASVKAQEITEIRLDLNTYTLYDAAENHADVVRVTGDKPESLAVLFHNVLVAPKVCPGVTFQLKGVGVSNSMNGVSLAIPSGPGTVKVQASGGTTTLLVIRPICLGRMSCPRCRRAAERTAVIWKTWETSTSRAPSFH